MKRHLQTFAAALLVCGFAVAQYPTRARFGAPGWSSAEDTAAAIAATGWTYVSGTNTSTSTGDVTVSGQWLVSGGLYALAASPNILRTLGGGSDYINMGEANGIEIAPSIGQRVRIVGNLMTDGTLLINSVTDQSADCDNAATGNATVGKVCIQAGQGSMVLTNSSVTAASIIQLTNISDDTTCLSPYATPGAGTVTIGCVGAATATANTVIAFLVIN